MAVADEDRGRLRSQNELVLPAGEYAYTRDTTSGVTFVRLGPTVVNAQAQDEPVIYDAKTGRYRTVPLTEAAQVNTVVPTGHYAVLSNPTANGQFPEAATKTTANELRIGQRVHIPGPTTFALWPRQSAKVIEGHQLRSNQYLIVRVYDEEAAKANWAKAVVKKAAPAATGEEPKLDAVVTAVATGAEVPEDLSVGRLLVIRGTEVSFYIPPTGVEVVTEGENNYVREALTLERLQYCILIDENGSKRYVRGPNVVFPLPTERFHENPQKDRRFRPIELNGPIQGLHIKVIAEYTDENGDHGEKGKTYKAGDELFITGKTTPIYFPCEQHSAIKYDGNTKHFATAIPAGDARYLLHRHTGVIKMVSGGEVGTMHLPDPCEEVFVRRVLTDIECETMYPGNVEALEYNRKLRELQAKAPTTRKGVVSEGEALRQRVVARDRMALGDAEFADASFSHGHSSAEMGGDEFTRSATYTEPRTVTLGNDKFGGVPKINPWTGYAVMVVDTAGNRRVEIGPKRVLLDFNETLETLALSTGKPKTTDKLMKTAYLQVNHNKVTDILQAQTADHVDIEVKAAFRVNFVGDDPTRWFNVANYVKLLSDHARAVLKAAIRQVSVEDFFKRSEDFIRDTVLGPKPADGGPRRGMFFEENSMNIYDVEVFMVKIGDQTIQTLLASAQHEAVRTSVELAQEHRRLEATQEREKIQQEAAKAQAETAEFKAALETEQIMRTLRTVLAKVDADTKSALARIEADVEVAESDLARQKAQDVVKAEAATADIARHRARADNDLAVKRAQEELRLNAIAQEAEATIKQLTAVQPGFSEALLALGNQETLVKVADAMSVQAFLGGKTLPEVVQRVFQGTPLEKLVDTMQKRALPTANGTSSATPRA